MNGALTIWQSSPSIMMWIVLAPVLGSFLLPLIGVISAKARNILALLLVLISLLGTILLIPPILAGYEPAIEMKLGFGESVFRADGLAVFMAFVSSMVSSIIVFYSFGYIKRYPNQNEYYFMVVLFLGSMMGLVFADNLIILYVFWELTAIASWRLIGFFREKSIVLKADKAFLMTFFGALLMLLGFISLYSEVGSFDFPAIREFFAHGKILNNTTVCLILAGILAKSATLPLQTWLPDAGVAPSPVTALLHAAVLVKIGVYVYARLFVVMIPIDDFWQTALPLIAGLSALIAAGAALIETDIKRIIAFSTISQIGYIFMGFAIDNEMAVFGSMLYILMHGLAEGGLFLCAGIVEHGAHTKDIRKMGGLFKVMPITAISFFICAFSVMGIPPTGGFFGKFSVISGASAAITNKTDFLLVSLFVGTAVLTIIYLLRLFYMVFLGEAKLPDAHQEGTPVMVFSVAFLAFLTVLSGLAINPIARFTHVAVVQMLGIM
jgi:NADH:ubiquinone oxidoreductase subunit 5 (subunit L)/multisubunit Na+/H+ antiporter MnhA subunit